jgi:hypothetical protein
MFIAGELLLLKRRDGNKSYSIAAKLPLLGKKISIEQTALF